MGRRCVTKDWMGKWRLIGSEGDEARRLGWKRDELGRIRDYLRGFGWKEMSCEGLKEIRWGGWIGKE